MTERGRPTVFIVMVTDEDGHSTDVHTVHMSLNSAEQMKSELNSSLNSSLRVGLFAYVEDHEVM